MSWVRTTAPSAGGVGIWAFLQHAFRAVRTVWAATHESCLLLWKVPGTHLEKSLSCLPWPGLVPAVTMKAAGITAPHDGSVPIYITIHSSKSLTVLPSLTKASEYGIASMQRMVADPTCHRAYLYPKLHVPCQGRYLQQNQEPSPLSGSSDQCLNCKPILFLPL